ncbi:hypothetical protein [Merismopedia glauca]|uniref:Uncharacterized protein n=1 Tax=Merismopedia glauca CCAP 1448/3 TaxID=1296344 RepID=A0A2T1BXL2_9CYAN|nr:hypothetical protein [Merismopedia glauca]PSB00731.1 hypothetical protein C7B64_21945 [Merismopedia glauca CCAP 1448/3]
MTQEIVTTFWQTSGITGVAIWESNSQLHIFTKRRLSDWEKQAISQIIRNNLQEYVQNPNHSQFTVMGHYAQMYIEFPFPPLIILTQSEVFKPPHIANLQLAIKQDYQQVIAIFEKLVKSELTQSTKKFNIATSIYGNALKSTQEDATIQELVNALNEMTIFCHKYIGQTMTIKHLEKSRPDDNWLSQFQISKSHQIMFIGNPQQKLTTDQKTLMKQWIKNFLEQLSFVLSNLPDMLEKSALTEKQKSLLLR